MRETQVRSLGREDPLEKEMVTHSSILTWKLPWTEEPGGLQSIGSQRVGHNLMTEHTCTPYNSYHSVKAVLELTRHISLVISTSKWSEVVLSCPTLSGPVDCSLWGFSIHGILQVRILEWVTISSSRRSAQPRIEPRSPALQADALPSEPPGKP